MMRSGRKTFTAEEFADEMGWDLEAVRQRCRNQEDGYGNIARLPDGYTAIKEKGKWLIRESVSAFANRMAADFDGDRVPEPGDELVKDLIPAEVHNAWELDINPPDWYEWLEPRITKFKDELIRCWALEFFFCEDLGESLYSSWCLWKQLASSRQANQTQIDKYDEAKTAFKIRNGRKLLAAISRCHHFSDMHNAEVTMTLNFKPDGSWDATVKEPQEPLLFDYVVCNSAFQRIILKWAQEVQGQRISAPPKNQKGDAICIGCAKVLLHMRSDAKFCSPDAKIGTKALSDCSRSFHHRNNQKGLSNKLKSYFQTRRIRPSWTLGKRDSSLSQGGLLPSDPLR